MTEPEPSNDVPALSGLEAIRRGTDEHILAFS